MTQSRRMSLVEAATNVDADQLREKYLSAIVALNYAAHAEVKP